MPVYFGLDSTGYIELGEEPDFSALINIYQIHESAASDQIKFLLCNELYYS